MSYIYLASPYTATDKFTQAARFRAASQACASLMERGEIVFSPVVYGHALEQRVGKTFPYAYWIRWSKVMLSGANRVYVLTLPGWQESAGLATEIQLAIELNKSVQGFAFGPDAEDISGFDILGHFGVILPVSRPYFERVVDRQED
jgi:hypothetical protein